MIKFLKSIVLTTVVLTSLATSRPSQATVGLLTLNAPLLLKGLVISGSGFYAGLAIEDRGYRFLSEKTYKPVLLTTMAYTVIGLIMLEDEQSMSFAEISSSEASKLGISASELAIYNSQLDEVNALFSHVDSELSSIAKPSIQDSSDLWASVKGAVAPETFSVMQKISAQAL